MHTNEFIIARSPKQLMFWSKKILTNEVDMKDKGGWHIADKFFLVRGTYIVKILMRFHRVEKRNDPGLYFSKITSGQDDDKPLGEGRFKML